MRSFILDAVPSPRHQPIRFSPPDVEAVERERARFKSAGLAPQTIIGYQRDFRVFTTWCEAAGKSSMPATPDTVELYVCDLITRGRKVTTLERHAVAIQHIHRLAHQASPCGPELRELLKGARRILAQLPAQKEALRVVDLVRIAKALGSSPIGARDRAVVLLGFASALRRKNLATLQLADVTFTTEGLLLRVTGEKQDRRGLGRRLAIHRGKHRVTCPVRAVRRWLTHRGTEPGPLFCRVMRGHPNGKGILGNRIAQIVQNAVRKIGLDPRLYAAHSMRAGLVTEAWARGVGDLAIARQTGHASLETLRLYVRERDLFRGNASGMLGL